ncbi:MAG TPA: hypothetical protein VK158_04310 [Acidobacteriota bacterium]|nr:hypothetical protein [Acidobacteriota bacterium]
MTVHLKKREIIVKRGRNRAPRAKTFTSLDAAQAHAKAKGFKKFEITNLRLGQGVEPKFRVDEL